MPEQMRSHIVYPTTRQPGLNLTEGEIVTDIVAQFTAMKATYDEYKMIFEVIGFVWEIYSTGGLSVLSSLKILHQILVNISQLVVGDVGKGIDEIKTLIKEEAAANEKITINEHTSYFSNVFSNILLAMGPLTRQEKRSKYTDIGLSIGPHLEFFKKCAFQNPSYTHAFGYCATLYHLILLKEFEGIQDSNEYFLLRSAIEQNHNLLQKGRDLVDTKIRNRVGVPEVRVKIQQEKIDFAPTNANTGIAASAQPTNTGRYINVHYNRGGFVFDNIFVEVCNLTVYGDNSAEEAATYQKAKGFAIAAQGKKLNDMFAEAALDIMDSYTFSWEKHLETVARKANEVFTDFITECYQKILHDVPTWSVDKSGAYRNSMLNNSKDRTKVITEIANDDRCRNLIIFFYVNYLGYPPSETDIEYYRNQIIKEAVTDIDQADIDQIGKAIRTTDRARSAFIEFINETYLAIVGKPILSNRRQLYLNDMLDGRKDRDAVKTDIAQTQGDAVIISSYAEVCNLERGSEIVSDEMKNHLMSIGYLQYRKELATSDRGKSLIKRAYKDILNSPDFIPSDTEISRLAELGYEKYRAEIAKRNSCIELVKSIYRGFHSTEINNTLLNDTITKLVTGEKTSELLRRDFNPASVKPNDAFLVQGAVGFVQSKTGKPGNHELIIPLIDANGGLGHIWRANSYDGEPIFDLALYEWSTMTRLPPAEGRTFQSVRAIQGKWKDESNTLINNIQVVALTREGTLYHFDRHTDHGWLEHGSIADGIVGTPGFIQTNIGGVGNLEVIAPLKNGGLQHFVCYNDMPNRPWEAKIIFGEGRNFQAVTILQSSIGHDLVVLAVERGNKLCHFFRNTTGWHESAEKIADGVAIKATGIPSFIQSITNNNFELIFPLAGEGAGLQVFKGVVNDETSTSWEAGRIVGEGKTFTSATVIQASRRNNEYDLDIIAVTKDKQMYHYLRTSLGDAPGWYETARIAGPAVNAIRPLAAPVGDAVLFQPSPGAGVNARNNTTNATLQPAGY